MLSLRYGHYLLAQSALSIASLCGATDFVHHAMLQGAHAYGLMVLRLRDHFVNPNHPAPLSNPYGAELVHTIVLAAHAALGVAQVVHGPGYPGGLTIVTMVYGPAACGVMYVVCLWWRVIS